MNTATIIKPTSKIKMTVCYLLSVGYHLLLATCYLLLVMEIIRLQVSDNNMILGHRKLAISCKKIVPFAPVVRLVLVFVYGMK